MAKAENSKEQFLLEEYCRLKNLGWSITAIYIQLDYKSAIWEDRD